MFKCPVGNCRLGDAASKRCVGSAGGWEHPQEKGVIKVKCGCGVTERTGGKSEEKRGKKRGFLALKPRLRMQDGAAQSEDTVLEIWDCGGIPGEGKSILAQSWDRPKQRDFTRAC